MGIAPAEIDDMDPIERADVLHIAEFYRSKSTSDLAKIIAKMFGRR